ncbi:type I-B CRISPR-associated protein Cas7/Cst2/DevR [Sulfurihydrogenibium azorense]|jgi:CRISPR-associated protein Cst2|uniref:type I-B CRISPR-associated protein Cas7/Cst2/DevR n=1 Tax=Sulfurihydrogenibium azorense TaxID=309806 RepID=UPI0024091766|nr:type I-B CRISPR-associated protein Cas7/Cst2/DevR [Sulfurihydrogenibium azorense]MDM7273054.1 type I-B CRISPR-associated protein Cas7/Cst2/DevR [Sulfurihydrogenibium azorense]
MKLTGVFVIETGVVNRGDGIGNIATVKKVNTPEGIKVFFSPVSYKRALWNALIQNKRWRVPLVTKEGGVVQRTGTIIDSEEFDFAGTMVAKPKYEREGTFLVDNGISINNYFGDMEFMTNMAISKLYGENEANIINKENFYGVYIMPFAIELDRVGVQEIKTVDTKIKDSDTIEEKIKKIYKALNLEDKITDIHIQEWVKIIESIDYDQEEKTTKIVLTYQERKRRVKELLEGMGELAKRIEGSERNLSPYFSAFSLDYIAPKYMLLIKDYLKKVFSDGGYLDTQDLSQKVQEFAKNEGKEIKTADYYNYNAVVNDLIKEIFKES